MNRVTGNAGEPDRLQFGVECLLSLPRLAPVLPTGGPIMNSESDRFFIIQHLAVL